LPCAFEGGGRAGDVEPRMRPAMPLDESPRSRSFGDA
jgi:hypothetical protein